MEKIYKITSGEEDPAKRYTMYLTATQAEMSDHIKSLIYFADKDPKNIEIDLGVLEQIDAEILRMIDDYIKHYGSNIPINSPEITYRDIAVIPFEDRFKFDEHEKKLLNSVDFLESDFHYKLATAALYLGINSLINALTKFFAKMIYDECFEQYKYKWSEVIVTTDMANKHEYLPHTGINTKYKKNETYGVMCKDCRAGMCALFGIKYLTKNKMNEWHKNKIYTNFVESLFFIEKLSPIPRQFMPLGYGWLAIMLSLTQKDPSCPMHYLGVYLNKIWILLLPQLNLVYHNNETIYMYNYWFYHEDSYKKFIAYYFNDKKFKIKSKNKYKNEIEV